MDKIKKFLDKKKIDRRFKKAGEGHTLAGSSSKSQPTTAAAPVHKNLTPQERVDAADIQACAAIKRLNLTGPQQTRSQQTIKLQAKKELEQEKEREKQSLTKEPSPKRPADEKHFDQAPVLDVQGVFFTCDLLGDGVILPKSQMIDKVKEFLTEEMSSSQDDCQVAASLMIHSLNRSQVRQMAVETLNRYIDNLLVNPEEPKFRRIRLSNKAFQDRIVSCHGGIEFLKSLGYAESMEKASDEQNETEQFLVMTVQDARNVDRIQMGRDILNTNEPIALKLYRNPTAYIVSKEKSLANPKLPSDFFDLSSGEIKKEQQTKTDQVESMLTLRTREMRDRDEKLRSYRYKYSLIRIKFPNNFVLEGTFGCHEKFGEIRKFVQEYISENWAPFLLRDSVGSSEFDTNKEEMSLTELNLFPAAVICFEWDPDVLIQWSQQSKTITYLREELELCAERMA